METIAKDAAKYFVAQITTATVNWINNGFNGNTGYPSDIGKFLTAPGGVLDRTFGDFIQNDPGLKFLCDPFRAQVLIALNTNFTTTLQDQIGCTATQIGQNISDAAQNSSISLSVGNSNTTISAGNYSQFTQNGGWDTWLRQTLQPQNTPTGAYMIASNELKTKLSAANNTATLEISNGQGAISLKQCVDTYWDADENDIGESPSYVQSYGYTPPEPPAGTDTTTTHCDVKTPGSIITGMLNMSSASDQKTAELESTMSDGIDAIFSALINYLVNGAKNKLKNGILDPSNNTDYNVALGQQLNYDYSNWFGNSSTSPAFGDVYGSSTADWFNQEAVIASTSGATSSIISGNISNGYIYDPIGQAKNNANILLNSFSKSESAYQNNYLIAQNVLIQAQQVFATSSACNMSYNNNSSRIRASLINANIITNIDGTQNNSDRTIASIPWNLQAIKSALNISSKNIKILNQASSDVGSASSISAVTDAMTPVNSTHFDTDPQTNLVSNIKTWLNGVAGMYSTYACPIDLAHVLKINTPATSTVSYSVPQN